MPAKALLDSANSVDEFLLVEFNRRPMLSVAFLLRALIQASPAKA